MHTQKRYTNITDLFSWLQTYLNRKATSLALCPPLSVGKRKTERYCAITFLRLKHNNAVAVTFHVA